MHLGLNAARDQATRIVDDLLGEDVDAPHLQVGRRNVAQGGTRAGTS